jgi:hypothetical protein
MRFSSKPIRKNLDVLLRYYCATTLGRFGVSGDPLKHWGFLQMETAC